MKNRICRVLAVALALLLALAVPALADVMKGDRGDSVREVQRKLIDLGYLTGSADGIFGGGTERAVIEFQKAEGLTPTGVVNGETYQRLTNPTARTSFARTAQLIADTTYGSNGAGNDGRTYWRLDLNIPRQSWMGEEAPTLTCSWASSVIDTSNDMSLAPSWNFAKKGETCTRFFFFTEENGVQYACFEIYLPDDPNLAGRRWMQISYPEETAIVYFNLTYKGNYVNGTGWALSDVAFESMGGTSFSGAASGTPVEAPAQAASQESDLLTAAEAMKRLEIFGGESGYDKSDPEMYMIGRNAKEVPVSYVIYCFIEQLPSEFQLTGVSWTFDVQEARSYSEYWKNNRDGWERAQKGETTYTNAFFRDTQSDGSIATQQSMDIYLPDDPSIAGEQWISLQCEDQRALVRLKLTYRGNYQNGTGWSIQYLNTTVDTIG